ncbi:MAG TPA: pyruvate dehydrogenase (acetyl-transferring), homodimeric type [Terriglobales bacterium]|nr:pyruvate dehydrogenase (acetyl-transferring), homodimeric type [Terriglobales bacterium]
MQQKLDERTRIDTQETAEWLEAFEQIVEEEGPEHGAKMLARLAEHAKSLGVKLPIRHNTPYVNTIPKSEEVPFPGDRALERTIKSLTRWNALAMVSRQNKLDHGIGGHIASYASIATLIEVAFNHFLNASYGDQPGDIVFFQGHSAPGIYARAFLEGRLTEEHLLNFRHELRDHPGLSSYPHPWLMPNFWTHPSVSMGLSPITAIYTARFMRYLENRSLIPITGRKIWAFLGDGEMDEPESLGSITLASREELDNLIFVVNCNLQRLDGPVRGNGSIIQELEASFHGAGWNVIKVLWGSNWDPLLERDKAGMLVKLMGECVDGEYQSFKAKSGAFVRSEFFGKYPETLQLVADMSDEEIWNLRRGGHDPVKVYNAYRRAMDLKGRPTVILAKTIKGYGVPDIQSRNPTHQQKQLNEGSVELFREYFDIQLPEDDAKELKFYRPPDDSPEMKYLHERRRELGGYMPERRPHVSRISAPENKFFKPFFEASKAPHPSSTMAFVRLLTMLMKHPQIGKHIVPIIPDEARTFGMESLFRQFGIYAAKGQLYKPHDSDMFLYYKEQKDGQILEEGITEAGSTASFTAAGTAYSNFGVEMIPFYTFYSMFGFQRVQDLIWAFADARGKGFLMGATAGRTTLAGEGLQHQDGHSLVLATTVPTCTAYDPAYAYEIALIVQDGVRRMYQLGEDRFYYLTLYNENYAMPPMPEGAQEGILKGIYRFRAASKGPEQVQLFGSGPILNEAVRAQEILADRYGVAAGVWSVTSYSELRREALEVDRWNRLHPDQPARRPYIQARLENVPGPIIAATDYMKIVADQLAPWIPGRMLALGTDGFGRSDNREYLRRFFEVNAESIACAALSRLARDGKIDKKVARKAFADLGVNPDTKNPALA